MAGGTGVDQELRQAAMAPVLIGHDAEAQAMVRGKMDATRGRDGQPPRPAAIGSTWPAGRHHHTASRVTSLTAPGRRHRFRPFDEILERGGVSVSLNQEHELWFLTEKNQRWGKAADRSRYNARRSRQGQLRGTLFGAPAAQEHRRRRRPTVPKGDKVGAARETFSTGKVSTPRIQGLSSLLEIKEGGRDAGQGQNAYRAAGPVAGRQRPEIVASGPPASRRRAVARACPAPRCWKSGLPPLKS